MTPKKNVVFVCESNTCRSQMAEGWAHHFHADRISAFSAGISPSPLDPLAVKVMREEGVDISKQESHSVQEFLKDHIDYVVTVCSEAARNCPTFPPEVNIINQPFDNPPELVRDATSEEAKLAVYRRVRDEIRQFVQDLPQKLR